MSLVYTGKGRHNSRIQVEVPTEPFITSVKVTVTLEEQGKPEYPKSYRAEETIEISMEREEFRTMLNCLDAVI